MSVGRSNGSSPQSLKGPQSPPHPAKQNKQLRSHFGSSMAAARARCGISSEALAEAVQHLCVSKSFVVYSDESTTVTDSVLDVESIKSQHDLLNVFHGLDSKMNFKKSTLSAASSQRATKPKHVRFKQEFCEFGLI
jgi:hypothetical protein